MYHLLKKKTLPVFLLLLIMTVFLTAAVNTAEAAKKKRAAPPVDRYASIVIEASTGFVLSEKNADKRLYPASLTKMMTLYMTFEALENGTLRKNQRLTVSKRAAQQEPSKIGIPPGGSIRVEDAILALVTKSANDVAVILAEGISGSEDRFARAMTAKARQLGMNATNFSNASGLHNSAQYSTARDMATLGQALIRDFPRHYRYFSTSSFSYAGVTHKNHNKLMATYDGMDGIKTGYVNASGYNLVASATRGSTRLIGVVFGGKTSQSRNLHMAGLLDSGFTKISDVRIAGLISSRSKSAAVPLRKPPSAATVPLSQEVAAWRAPETRKKGSTTAAAPAFNAMDLVAEEGDTDDQSSPASFAEDFRPRPLNTNPIGDAGSDWTIQVGAFSSHAAGLNALKAARQRLPSHIIDKSRYMIVPLMTNRGVIYRARFGGLLRREATEACNILQGSCLILNQP